MPESGRIAVVNPAKKVVWTNVHQTVSQNCNNYYSIQLPQPGDGTKIVADMRACATILQGIFRDAIAAGQKLRCIGGGWSLSDAAVTDGWLLDTLAMNLYWTMEQQQVDANYKFKNDISGLYLFQSGVTIQDVNTIVETDGKSISTSGASNGQTIAGAIATGTHGSAFQYGSMTEFVVGFHLIVDPEKVIWLERASYPVVSDEFAAELGAELQRDDDLFNAVLVSFGSIGMLAGVMIETEKKYLFEAQRFRIQKDLLHDAMNTMQLKDLPLPHPEAIPWHFEVTFNPHDVHGGGYVRTLYKIDYTDDYTKPVMPTGALGPGEGLLGIIGTVSNALLPATVSLAMNLLAKNNLPLYGPVKGTNGEIFSLTTLQGRAMSMELGIAMEDSSRVLDLLLGLSPEIDVYLGVISFRWVKQTTAMIGFTKFPVTATIEFNAAYNNRTLAYYNRIWAELTAQNITYTLHWGQMNNFTPELVRKMYGPAADKWMACRDTLMSSAAKAVFTSNFLQSTGLG